MTAKTTTQRQQALKAKRKAEGLVRLELWIKPEHKEAIKSYAKNTGENMRELPEPAIKPSELIVPVGVGGGLYTERQVLAIQKQAYEDGLRDAGKDAERYRWLRVCGDLDALVKIVKDPGRWETPYPVLLECDELDSAVDAAMLTASQKEQK